VSWTVNTKLAQYKVLNPLTGVLERGDREGIIKEDGISLSLRKTIKKFSVKKQNLEIPRWQLEGGNRKCAS
jgi:hypothetical protein